MKELKIKLLAIIFSLVSAMTAHALTLSGDNVGIGKDTPQHPLDVSGNVNADSFTGSGAGLTGINPSNIAKGTANISIFGTANSVVDGSVTAGKIAFYGRVIIVDKNAGGNYDSPVDALASITDSGETNP